MLHYLLLILLWLSLLSLLPWPSMAEIECMVCRDDKSPRHFPQLSGACTHPPKICRDCARRALDTEISDKAVVSLADTPSREACFNQCLPYCR